VTAWATSDDSVRPELRACARSRWTTEAGSLTVNTTVGSGTATAPTSRACSTYRRACRSDSPPARELPGRLDDRDAGVEQFGGGVDAPRPLVRSRPTALAHDTAILR